jgi:hypothetical protein
MGGDGGAGRHGFFFSNNLHVTFLIKFSNGRCLMIRRVLWRGLLPITLLAAVLYVQPLHGATITLGSNADTYLRDATPRGGLVFMDVRGAALDFRGYQRFDLAALGAGSTINSATLTYTVSGGASRNDTLVNGRFALYGLNNVAGNTPQNWDEATLVPATKGTEDVTTLMGVTDLDDNVLGISEVLNPAAGSAAPGTTVTISGAPLVAFLQSRLDDGGLTTFILSNDDATDRGYGLASKENATEAYRPTLTIDYTEIPEPASGALLAIGWIAFAAACRRRHENTWRT